MNDPRDSSQNIIFSRIKNVTKHSLVYGLFDFLGKAGALILVPLYAKMLSASDFGMLELFLVTGALLLVVSVMGFNSALTRYYITEPDGLERNLIFQTTFLAVLSVAGILAIILSLCAGPISALFFSTTLYASYWRLVFVTVGFDATCAVVLALFRSQMRPGIYSWINLSKLILTLCLNIAFVGFLHWGVKGVLIGNLLGSLGSFFLCMIFAARHIAFRFSRKYFYMLRNFGWPLLISGIGFFIMNSVDRYFLKTFTTLTDLGTYALGYKIGMIMSLAVNAFTIAWSPLMFKIAGDPEAKRTFSTIITYYFFITSVILIGVASFSGELVRLIGTTEYSAASQIIVFVLLSYLFQGVYALLSTGVTITDNTRVVPIIVGFAGIINLASNFLLIPRYKIMGAAISTILSYAFLPIAMYFVGQRFYRIPIESRRIATLVLGSAALLALNMSIIGEGSLLRTGVKLMVVASYPFFLFTAHFFTREEIIRIKIVGKKVIHRFIPWLV